MGKRILGLDIGGTNIKAGVIVSSGNFKKHKRAYSNTPLRYCNDEIRLLDFKSVCTDIGNLVEQVAGLAKSFKADALGIGIAGLVGNGIIYSSPNLSVINNLRLKDTLIKKLKIPVTVENDANMYAFGEWKYGAGKGTHNLLLLTLGTGVGGGIIANDKLYSGAGFAGEVGHTTIDPNGPACSCGNYGCLETYVGSAHLENKAKQGIKIGIKTSLSRCKEITPKIISEKAYKGDMFARLIIESAGYYLGIGIANLCATLDPETVVIGGGVAKTGDLLFNKIKETLIQRLFLLPYTTKHGRKGLSVVPAKLGDKSGVLGSIAFVEDKL